MVKVDVEVLSLCRAESVTVVSVGGVAGGVQATVDNKHRMNTCSMSLLPEMEESRESHQHVGHEAASLC